MAILTETFELARDKARSVDRVVVTIGVLLLAITALAPTQILESLHFTGTAVLGIAPFIIASVLVAAYAKATGLDGQIARAFSGKPVQAVLLAAAFGALSPFCSCGVVPIIAGLLGAGVPLAPVMAFWLASPLMDPEMFIIMTPVFGIEFTLAKTMAAFGIGMAAGLTTHALAKRAFLSDPLTDAVGGCGSCCNSTSSALSPKAVVWRFWPDPARRSDFADVSRTTGWFLFKWLTLAFLLESLMVAYIPAESVGAWLGGGNWWTVPAAVLVGVPTYLNGYAAIPTVAALIDMGMAPGAGLAFMIAGGITSIPAAMAVYPLVRRPVFFWYIFMGLVGSLIAAYLFQAYMVFGG